MNKKQVAGVVLLVVATIISAHFFATTFLSNGETPTDPSTDLDSSEEVLPGASSLEEAVENHKNGLRQQESISGSINSTSLVPAREEDSFREEYVRMDFTVQEEEYVLTIDIKQDREQHREIYQNGQNIQINMNDSVEERETSPIEQQDFYDGLLLTNDRGVSPVPVHSTEAITGHNLEQVNTLETGELVYEGELVFGSVASNITIHIDPETYIMTYQKITPQENQRTTYKYVIDSYDGSATVQKPDWAS